MTKVFVDGKLWKEVPPGADRGWLDELKAAVLRGGRVIVGLSDGSRPVTEEEVFALEEMEQLLVETRNVRELVREALEECARYVPVLANGLKVIADAIDEGQLEKSFKLITQATEGLGWVVQVIQNAQILLRVEDREVGDGALGQLKDRLVRDLEALVGYMREGRYDDVAFELREEVAPAVARLLDYVEALRSMASLGVQ